ncbi:MAG: hypothetical protein AAF441_20040 [Pseudomonadota bacterium]
MSTMTLAIERAAGNAQANSHTSKIISARTWIRAVTFLAPTLFLAAVLLQPWVEAKWMFLDPLTAAQLSGDCCHTYYGFVSQAGVMLWSATAAVCLFAAAVFALHGRSSSLIGFAASAGLLTGWLALDDTFLVHEVVFPSFGIPQNAVLVAYAVLGILYALASWRMILKSDFLILFAGGGALALSMVVDSVFHSLVPQLVYLEDSAKFFGIFCWAAFHIVAMAEQLSPAARRA